MADEEAAKILAELGIGGDESAGANASSNANKKKKKKKKGKKPAGGGDQGNKSGGTALAAKLAQERLAREKEEAERLKKEEEERIRLEEEEERKRVEEQNRIEEEKRLKAERKKKKKEEARAQGKAVTKAEKAREAKARAAREKLIAQGLIQVDEDGNVIQPSKEELAAKRKKEQAEAKKRKEEALRRKKEKEEAAKKKKEEEEAAAKKKKEEEEAAKKKKEEEEAAAAAAAAAAAEEEDEEDDGDDWGGSDDDWEVEIDVSQINATLNEEVVEEEVVKKGPIQAPTAKNEKKNKTGKKAKKAKKLQARKEKRMNGMNAGDDYDSDDSADDDDETSTKLSGAEQVRLKRLEKEAQIEKARAAREARLAEAMKNRSKDDLRSPICVVMGHVDVGKTKLLDKIRRTNVQDGEAGGITQQIGATYFPMDNLKKSIDRLNKDLKLEFNIPGLLVIDTPGHESFANLRKRGSSLCDVAVLVIDLMHGLEQQTIESINMLRSRKLPFVVALNKVDRLYSWKAQEGRPIREALKEQDDNVLSEFEMRVNQIIVQLNEQNLNAKLYYENDDYKTVVSLVPTSAHTGEGIPDLLLLISTLTQQLMLRRLMFADVPEATVLDRKVIEGLGSTIDILLVNGKLKKGDEIVVAGTQGPIVTQIRALLTPGDMKEMRVATGGFVKHDELKAAIGIKIAAQNLENAIAGTQMMVVTPDDDVEELCDSVTADVAEVMGNISTTGRGVSVQASTLGSLEALMEFLRTSNIPVASVNLGSVHKKDVIRASIQLEHDKKYACILAFDVKITKEAQDYADAEGISIYRADIIYHLFDQFTARMKEIDEERKQLAEKEAVFPCVLKIIPTAVFNKRNPLIFGVEVKDGICKVGTPLVCTKRFVPDPENEGQQIMLRLGKIVSIEKDGVAVEKAFKGESVAIKIQGRASESHVAYGRHFDETDELTSKLTRESIDLLKANFKDDLKHADWALVVKLKPVFQIA